MHADLTWLPINPANMATKDQPVKQKDWVEVPTHVVRIEHPQRREADLGLRRPTRLPARPGRPVRDVLGPEGGAAARRVGAVPTRPGTAARPRQGRERMRCRATRRAGRTGSRASHTGSRRAIR